MGEGLDWGWVMGLWEGMRGIREWRDERIGGMGEGKQRRRFVILENR